MNSMNALRSVIAGLAVAAICYIATTSHPWLCFIPAVVLGLAMGDPKVLRSRLFHRH